MSSLWTIGIAHTVVALPYTLLIIASRLAGFDPSLEEAAMDLGADYPTALRRVVLPLIFPAMVSAWLTAFTVSFDEFALALSCDPSDLPQAEQLAERILHGVTRPMEIDGRQVQIGAFVGIAASNPADGPIPNLLRRADIALDRSKSLRSARPIWFDEGMERALVAHCEIEQGIRYGLEHRQEALNYAMKYGRDLDPAKADRFVGMYVNDWTLDFGPRGREAVSRLLDEGHRAGVIPQRVEPEVVDG